MSPAGATGLPPVAEPRFVAINGSGRRRGTTAAVLEIAAHHVASRGSSMEVIHLAEHRVVACTCGRCNSRADPCPVDDDVDQIVASMLRADAVLYAAPVHGFGLSAVMQTFVERAGVGVLRFARPLTNKVGGVVVVGRRYTHEAVHAQLVDNLMLNRMILPGSGFPATVRAGGPDDVVADTEGLAATAAMLDRMLELGRVLRARPMDDAPPPELRVGTLS